MRALVATSIVLGVAGFWVYKARYLLLTPLVAPLAISALHVYCAYWIVFESTGIAELLVAFALASALSRPMHTLLNRIELAWLQKYRDHRANRIFNAELTVPFALYLRPFAVTDRLGFYGISAKWGGVDLEALLAHSCRSWGELLALGQPGEAIGAGRIVSSDEDWKNKFHLLAERAKIIIVIPAINEGTFFEIAWLKSNRLLRKTIFVMPPKTLLRMSERAQLAFTPNYDRTAKDYAKNWEDVRARAEDIGLRFPPYAQRGALIESSSDGAGYSEYMFGEGVPSIKNVFNDRLGVQNPLYCDGAAP